MTYFTLLVLLATVRARWGVRAFPTPSILGGTEKLYPHMIRSARNAVSCPILDLVTIGRGNFERASRKRNQYSELAPAHLLSIANVQQRPSGNAAA